MLDVTGVAEGITVKLRLRLRARSCPCPSQKSFDLLRILYVKLSRLALAVALLPLAAHAEQSNAYQDSLALPPLVVTSGRHAEPIQQATAVTTVFTRQDIERLQVRSVAELLERVPGVSVSRTGGAGSQTGLFVRGTATAQTLVLVDGQRISAASSGTSSLEFLSPEQIEALQKKIQEADKAKAESQPDNQHEQVAFQTVQQWRQQRQGEEQRTPMLTREQQKENGPGRLGYAEYARTAQKEAEFMKDYEKNFDWDKHEKQRQRNVFSQ